MDQPDTPAPVFAARAFKSVLFGAPTAASSDSRRARDAMAHGKAAKAPEPVLGTPTRPPGILLTPGTGTSRRKRVSFGRDVPASSANSGSNAKGTGLGSRRTMLTEALENSRRKKTADTATASLPQQQASDSDDDWVEEDDDDYCTTDMTLDLNEPHSHSGRYWKEEFEKYHREAKAEMEKLLKYKQLAKSYAQQKDAEAIQLAAKLRNEQQKVIDMEKKIADNATQIASRRSQSADEEPTALLAKLSKQTTLAAQYRRRVQELEASLDFVVRQKGEEGVSAQRRRRQAVTSPGTQKTLVETQRELRRARIQLRELDALRDEVTALKARAKSAEGLASRGEADEAGGPRARELRAQLKQAVEESKKRDEEMALLRGEFESFREQSEAREADIKAVLERAHAKIADLRKEAKMRSGHARSAGADSKTTAPKGRDDGHRRPSVGDDNAAAPRIRATPWRNAGDARACSEDTATAAKDAGGGVLAERPNLEKPKWQPFVPRSPKNRGYLGEALERRIRNGGATPGPTRSRSVLDADECGLGQRRGRAGEIDLLRDRFVRLGGPECQGEAMDGSARAQAPKSSALPPERRAAALARIEERMAKKKQTQRRKAQCDKENARG